jgi:hypothetical protein
MIIVRSVTLVTNCDTHYMRHAVTIWHKKRRKHLSMLIRGVLLLLCPRTLFKGTMKDTMNLKTFDNTDHGFATKE